jgi:hypothetical protein
LGQIFHSSHLKDTVEAAVVNLVHTNPVLRHAIVANKSGWRPGNPRLKIDIRLLQGFHHMGLRQRDGRLRQLRFHLFNLAEVSGVTKQPYDAR